MYLSLTVIFCYCTGFATSVVPGFCENSHPWICYIQYRYRYVYLTSLLPILRRDSSSGWL